ncbi:MAG TPA: cache domain-containing protein, partial [Xanthomonadales bacterium]|nr:cache domain-containing protein [Xanthomonadales bacterium]
MGFRLRLALFLVATLVSIQLLTAVLVYAVTRGALIDEGERQLVVAARAFVRQLDDISERVATNVQVLALDYALRAAIAQRDQGTVRSVLRNHGRRVGAERMLLIGLDGRIEADTSDVDAASRTFPYPELLDNAYEARSAAVVALEGRAYWIVVVPVHAPQPVGLIAAGIPIDAELLQRLQSRSALPQELELVVRAADGSWTPLAHGTGSVELGGTLAAAHPELPEHPTLIVVDGREYVALATRLSGSPRQQPIAAVLGYSLDEALAAYRPVG